MPKTRDYILQVIPEEIMFIVTIFHSYGHIAVVRTLDASRGKIQISVAPGSEDVFHKIVNSLQNDVFIKIISEGEN